MWWVGKDRRSQWRVNEGMNPGSRGRLWVVVVRSWWWWVVVEC